MTYANRDGLWNFGTLGGSRLLGVLGFLMLAPGCGSGNPSTDVTLDPPEHGFQLKVDPFPLLPGSEVQDCYYFKAPISAPMDAHRLEAKMNAGSHHMNLFRFVGMGSTHFDGEIQRGCWDAVPFQTWDLVFNSQTFGDNDWTLPAGVSHHIEPGDMFMLQTHYVNANTQQTDLGRGKVLVNFYEAAPGDAQFRLGSMFANNRAIMLPPHDTSTFTADCYVPANVKFVAVAGHFHSRGTEFDIGLIDGNGANYQQIYQSLSWNDPPWGTFDPGMPSATGGGLRYTCQFNNTTDQTIRFGPDVEFEEHCNVFAYYYPALPGRSAIYCF